ncbi:unnamed protein product, partial [Nesidiocoris tenuis]
MGENALQRIEDRSFDGLGRLEYLDLHDNKIAQIHDQAFRDLRRLQELNLKNNRLETLQAGLLKENVALRSLDISHNLIASLPENSLNDNRITGTRGTTVPSPRTNCCIRARMDRQNQVRSKSNIFIHSKQCWLYYRITRSFWCAANGQQQIGETHGWKDPNLKPLPEESDYFYEDYIEYDDNTTKVITGNHNINNLVEQAHNGQQTYVAPTAAPPQAARPTQTTQSPPVMSHYVPGDTPTIYAKPTTNSIVGSKPTPKPTQYTFFGMPLPTLNIGNFWGSSRNNDGKSRFPGAKARIQQVTTTTPKVENGFLPILQSDRGGFKPIFNPYNQTDNYERINSITVKPE